MQFNIMADLWLHFNSSIIRRILVQGGEAVHLKAVYHILNTNMFFMLFIPFRFLTKCFSTRTTDL